MTELPIKSIIEATLFVAEKPLTIDHFLEIFSEEKQPERSVIRATLRELRDDYAERGVELVQIASGYRFQTKPDLTPWIKRLWATRPPRYSRALLETIAIIAYRQPITRGEIETIRGISVSTDLIKRLQDYNWIRILAHRKTPGRPALYGTTREFLNHFNLKSLNDLPTLAELQEMGDEQLFGSENQESSPTTIDMASEENKIDENQEPLPATPEMVPEENKIDENQEPLPATPVVALENKKIEKSEQQVTEELVSEENQINREAEVTESEEKIENQKPEQQVTEKLVSEENQINREAEVTESEEINTATDVPENKKIEKPEQQVTEELVSEENQINREVEVTESEENKINTATEAPDSKPDHTTEMLESEDNNVNNTISEIPEIETKNINNATVEVSKSETQEINHVAPLPNSDDTHTEVNDSENSKIDRSAKVLGSEINHVAPLPNSDDTHTEVNDSENSKIDRNAKVLDSGEMKNITADLFDS
jgi:segregation and condensation protein B